jgi:hypothetical protein
MSIHLPSSGLFKLTLNHPNSPQPTVSANRTAKPRIAKAISSSSASNSVESSFSPSYSSSSTSLSASSIDSIPESREPTPEHDPIAAHEALAPLHWNAEDFNFGVISKRDEPQTEGEDLQSLLGGEMEESEDDKFSWDGVNSSLEEEIDSSSDSAAGKAFRFLRSSEEGSEEEDDDGGGYDSGNDTSGSSSNDDTGSGDDDDNDGGSTPARSPKRRRYLGTYWW